MVYGHVDKSPCVYYDLYSTTVQNGGRDYAISPDLSPIKEIKSAYVFDNDTYGWITEEVFVFNYAKEDTLFKNTTTNQILILGNRILVPKAIDVEETQENIEGLVAPITAFGMVEVQTVSDVVFNSSKFRLDYSTLWGKTKIVCYEESNGITPTSEVEGSYLVVKDFSSESSVSFPFEYWFWGDNSAYSTSYNNLYGESVINFESKKYFSDSNIVKTLLTNSDGDTKEISNVVQLNYELQANVTEVDSNNLPELWFQFTDVSKVIWNMDQTYTNPSETEHTISTGIGDYDVMGLTGGLTGIGWTKNPADNKFIIGQRKLENDNWQLQSQSGIINWLKINKLKVVKRVVLKDFINYDLYADVDGRVDNVSGDYTGIPQLTSEERQDYLQGRTMDTKASRFVTKPSKPSKVESVKPKTKITKKGSKY